MRIAVILLPFVFGAAFLAGCAGNESESTQPTPAPTSSGPGTGDAAAADDGAPWLAYRFDEMVEPRSGGAGKIESYSYVHTNEDADGVTIMDVTVEVLGVSTETVRAQSYDFSSGATEPQTISGPVEVAKLRHTLVVREDATGELEPGQRATATIWLPTQQSESAMTIWQFVHFDFAEGARTGVWENLPAEAGATTMAAPYTEGEDPSGWWGFEHLLTTYALSWWAALFEDASIEEGSHGFGGFQYTADRETLSVPGYTFDGWRVSWSAAADGDSGSYTVAVAPELPVPFEHAFSSTSGGVTSRYEYKLAALELG